MQDILERIEAKLDALIAALAEEDEEDETTASLDGTVYSRARDESQPL